MSKHALQLVIEEVNRTSESEEYKIRSYSGRSMYGKESLGIVLPGRLNIFIKDVIDAVGNLTTKHDCDYSDVADAFVHMQTDSLGHDTIVYFPGIPFVSDDSE